MRDNDRNSSPDTLLDARLDAALHTYAAPPPVPDPHSIAQKLLERATELDTRPAFPIWKWAVPAAACFIALVLAALWFFRAPQIPTVARTPAPPPTIAATHPPALPAQRAAIPAHPRRPVVAATASRPLPKLAVFPTPTPLSPQEQALVAFAEHAPPAVQRAVLQDQKVWNTTNAIAGPQPHPLPAANLQDQ